MKSTIRYKGNTNNTAVLIFFKGQKLPAMVPCLGEPPRRFLWCCYCIFISFCYLHFVVVIHFIFDLHFVFICWCSSFAFPFRHHPSPFRGLSPSFYTHFILLVTLLWSFFSKVKNSQRYYFAWENLPGGFYDAVVVCSFHFCIFIFFSFHFCI